MDEEIQTGTEPAAPPTESVEMPPAKEVAPPVAEALPEVAAPPTEPPPAAPEPLSAEDQAKYYRPIPIMPKKSVTILVGPRFPPAAPGVALAHLAKPANKTGFINWHDSLFDVLARISEPTDGSLVMLEPGTSYPILMYDFPYDHLKDGATVYVVPNRPDQVGPDAQVAS